MAEAGAISDVDHEGQQRRIREKIAEIDAVAEDFPAVLIIHDIRSQVVKYMGSVSDVRLARGSNF